MQLSRGKYIKDIQEEYDEMRKDYLNTIDTKEFVTLKEARDRRLVIDWARWGVLWWKGDCGGNKNGHVDVVGVRG